MKHNKDKTVFYQQIEIPFYKGWLYIAIGKLDQVAKEFQREGKDFSGVAATTAQLNNSNWLIGIDIDTLKKSTEGFVAHEAAHFCNSVFHSRGILYSLDNDEHFCYFLTWAVDNIHKFIKKYHAHHKPTKSKR